MAVGPIFRFVDPANIATIRLNLRDKTGWYKGSWNLGKKSLNKKFLSADGVDGAEMTDSWMDLVTMDGELILMPQTSAAAMETLQNALNTELRRPVNAIEYLPHGLTGTTWIIDTFRADEISLEDGDGGFSPWVRPGEGKIVPVEIDRLPDFRGRGTTA